MRRIRARLAIVVAIASVAAIGGIPQLGRRADAAAPTLGVFRGSGRPTEVKAYETWVGRSVPYALDFLGRGQDWSKIDDPSWWATSWAGSGRRMVYSVAMLPNTTTTLAAGAAGNYNSHWQRFGQTFVSKGMGDAVLRLGWEFNGKFYPWAAGGKEDDFARYWRQIVNTLRAIPGANFKFDWTPLAGNTNADVVRAYPGDAYVDYIGLDAYDTSSVHTSAQDRWNDLLNRTYGLVWHRNFAAAHGKPMTFPEWGLSVRVNDNLGGGDNPYYIARMYDWLNANNVAYAMYFEYDAQDAAHRLMTTQFPNGSREFKRLFSSTTAGSTTSTTAPPTTTSAPATTTTPAPATSTTTASATTTTTAPAATTTTAPAATTTTAPAGTAPEPQSTAVRWSQKSSRKRDRALSGLAIGGRAYIFYEPSTSSALRSITFYIDDPTMARAPYHTDSTAPYDLVGGTASSALALDTRAMANGTHTVTALLTSTSGTTWYRHATFTVVN